MKINIRNRLILTSFFILLFSCIYVEIESQVAEEHTLRIIVADAVLRLNPSLESPSLKKLPLGSVFVIAEMTSEWIKIQLPPDEDGFVVTGYVLKSEVEIESDIENSLRIVKIKLIDSSILNGILLEETDEKVTLEALFGTFEIDKGLIQELEIANQNQVDQSTEREVHKGDIVSLLSVDVRPKLIKSVAPKYRWNETLIVTEKFFVNILISDDGDIQDAKIMKENKTYATINQAVLKAVKQWKYKPAMKNGVPVKVWKVVVLRVDRQKDC